MAEPTLWQRMIECDFNLDILVEDAARYREMNTRCQIGIMVLSSGAVATIAAAWSFIAVVCALATAGLSAVTLLKKYADNAAECETMAQEWRRLRTGFERAHERSEQGNKLSADARQMLQLEFDRLVQLRQEPPEPDRDRAVMGAVLTRLGYTPDDIASLERGEALV